MRTLVARGLLFGVVSGSLGAFFWAREAHASLTLAVLGASVATLALAAVLERVMPWRAQWNEPRGDVGTDLASAGVLIGVVDPLLKGVAPLIVVMLYASLSRDPAQGLFPVTAPFAAQVVLATALIEFGRYWSHRWHHAHRALWWLHAMHHGSERLYTLNNFRFHPLNRAINFGLSTLPLMLLGAPQDVLLGYLAISQPVLMLQHANIDLRSGWLNWIFSSNELHRWHHSTEPAQANSNYGSAFVLWDQVFGTFQPADGSPQRVGLFGPSRRYPAESNYLAQLLSAFGPACCKA